MAKKTTCPITRGDFRAKAKPVTVIIDGKSLHRRRSGEFSTGSLGWYLNGKTTIDVGGTPVQVQIGLNLTIVGSKDLPPDAAAPAAAHTPAAPASAPAASEPADEGA